MAIGQKRASIFEINSKRPLNFVILKVSLAIQMFPFPLFTYSWTFFILLLVKMLLPFGVSCKSQKSLENPLINQDFFNFYLWSTAWLMPNCCLRQDEVPSFQEKWSSTAEGLRSRRPRISTVIQEYWLKKLTSSLRTVFCLWIDHQPCGDDYPLWYCQWKGTETTARWWSGQSRVVLLS